MIISIVDNQHEVSHAQVAEYYFTQQNFTYTEITGGTVLWSGTFDNEVSGEITIPSFTFNGTDYTSLYVSANGFITFGSAPTATNYTPISNTAHIQRSCFRIWPGPEPGCNRITCSQI